MSQYGDSPDSLQAARRALYARDDEIAAADRDLVEVLNDAHALALESIGRIEGIDAGLDDAAAQPPGDSPPAARELSRHLIARNREIAAVVSEAQAAAQAKVVAIEKLTDRYR